MEVVGCMWGVFQDQARDTSDNRAIHGASGISETGRRPVFASSLSDWAARLVQPVRPAAAGQNRHPRVATLPPRAPGLSRQHAALVWGGRSLLQPKPGMQGRQNNAELSEPDCPRAAGPILTESS